MNKFKLKPGLKFTPQEQRYIVLDTATQSTYRVGETEYAILQQFAELIDPEDVGLKLRAEAGLNVPYDVLFRFIEQAATLGLLTLESGSPWQRFRQSDAFAFRLRLFDPTPLLEMVLLLFRTMAGPLALAAACVVVATGLTILTLNFSALWVFQSFALPRYGLLMIAVVYLSSIGHELSHGAIAKYYGLDVREVGFHLHYFMPSFYCKILGSSETTRSRVVAVLLGGSAFDSVLLSLLAVIWWICPPAAPVRQAAAVGVCFLAIKIILIQLNPLVPFSDGFRVAALFLGKKGRSNGR